MKKLTILIAGSTLSAVLPLVADTETFGGYTWTYQVNGDTAEIYNNGIAAISPEPNGPVTIPATLGGKPVVGVGSGAFKDCQGLTGVTIPNGVTTIGNRAFDSCSDLKSVTIPIGVTNIGNYAFCECRGLANVTIPSSVVSIGDHAFSHCVSLAGVTIPSSVTHIGNYAFFISGLKSVTIPDSVTSIGESAFSSCSRLTRVTVPGSVADIGDYTFSYCSGLKGVTIGEGVTSIGNWAFSDCVGLKSVTIPGSVTRIKRSAFEDCRGLASVKIGNGVTSIGRGAFLNCSGLKSVVMPSSVTDIEDGTFVGCVNLTSVTLPAWCKNTYVYKSGLEYQLVIETVSGAELSSWQEYLGINSDRVKITCKDVDGGASGGDDAMEMWKKAQTVAGTVFRDGKVVGVVQVKVGKANKSGEVSVSGTITGLDGKKIAAKGGKVPVNGESATVMLAVKDGTTAMVTVDKEGVSGSWNGAEIIAVDVGGNWTRTDAKVHVAVTGASLPAGTLEALLPDAEPILAKGGKWAFNKAAVVKLSKGKVSAEWDTSKGKTNLSSMKLTYTPRTGLFKGSFKVYALEDASRGKKKLKKYTANVTGLVVDGWGYGQAAVKRPAAGPWAVVVE